MHHKAVFAAGDEVVDLEVLFPPAEEIIDLPSEFINQGEVFGGKVKAIGGHPIFRPTDSVTYQSKWFYRLVAVGVAKMQSTQNAEETQYERDQRFNFLMSWFHSLRYKNMLSLFRSVARKTEGKSIKVVEIGCAHAKLFSILNERFDIDYTGIEINPLFVETAQSRYGNNPNFRVIQESAANAISYMKGADILVALETFEHIPEHEVVRIIEAIATAQPNLFVCSVPVEIGPPIWLKNVGSLIIGYMRHTEYRWAETFWAGLYQLDQLPPHGTGHKGFDWRWLAQTIRHNMRILETRKFPFGFLPATFAFSVFIVAEPRK